MSSYSASLFDFDRFLLAVATTPLFFAVAEALRSSRRRKAKREELLRDMNEISERLAQIATSGNAPSVSTSGSSPAGNVEISVSDVLIRGRDAEADGLRERLARAEQRLEQFDATVPFEKEASNAKWASRIAFWVGVLVVAAVVLFGLDEWRRSAGVDQLSTGAGIARTGVLASAFYLAGQLFKRSTRLYLKAADLERAAIALRHVSRLAHDLPENLRNTLVFSVYRQHLTGSYEPDDGGSDESWMELLDRIRG